MARPREFMRVIAATILASILCAFFVCLAK